MRRLIYIVIYTYIRRTRVSPNLFGTYGGRYHVINGRFREILMYVDRPSVLLSFLGM